MTGAKDPSSKRPPDPKHTPKKAGGPPDLEFKPPLKPRPLLVAVLGILLVIWLAALVVMRLRTVHPATAPGAPAAPSGIDLSR